MDSKGNLIFFLGKCSIPFLKGNCNLIFPSFMSITAPTVRRKGRPKIIGQEGSHSMSIIVKSMGTSLSLTMIRTSSIFPKGFFTEESTRRTTKEQGSKGFNSSISYILLGITEVLAPTSQRAKQVKLFNLILIIESHPSSRFLSMEASTLCFSLMTHKCRGWQQSSRVRVT